MMANGTIKPSAKTMTMRAIHRKSSSTMIRKPGSTMNASTSKSPTRRSRSPRSRSKVVVNSMDSSPSPARPKKITKSPSRPKRRRMNQATGCDYPVQVQSSTRVMKKNQKPKSPAMRPSKSRGKVVADNSMECSPSPARTKSPRSKVSKSPSKRMVTGCECPMDTPMKSLKLRPKKTKLQAYAMRGDVSYRPRLMSLIELKHKKPSNRRQRGKSTGSEATPKKRRRRSAPKPSDGKKVIRRARQGTRKRTGSKRVPAAHKTMELGKNPCAC